MIWIHLNNVYIQTYIKKIKNKKTFSISDLEFMLADTFVRLKVQ